MTIRISRASSPRAIRGRERHRWDRGRYPAPEARDSKESEALLLEGLKKGDLKFILEGEKLKGEFALEKTARDAKSWLLLKKKDSWATTGDILSNKRSVASQKTLEDIAETTPGKAFREKNLGQIHRREASEGYDLGEAPAAGHATPHKTHAGHVGERAPLITRTGSSR